ncbi:MAG TPA: hypothetical protein VMM92_03895 [Thermoanaerobaculia bacterium]|nr:hypothetical protein [Thermoanaerobaculia bacterium]
MTRRKTTVPDLTPVLPALLLSLVLSLGLTGPASAQLPSPPVRLTAFAINLNAAGRAPAREASVVEIVIERWSAPDERGALLGALSQGESALLSALQKTPRVGYIRTPDSVALDLHYAHLSPDPNGGQRIFLATDRRIGFWEGFHNTRSLDYPFTLIEIHMGPDGKGEGRMSIATKVYADKDGYLRLEDYSAEPVRLQEVHLEKK